ncbi:MAG: bacteriocin-like protein [Crocinitomix sp.]|jgi:bacteriocin-like protein
MKAFQFKELTVEELISIVGGGSITAEVTINKAK